MLSRPSTAPNHLLKATLLAGAASLLVCGGLVASRMAIDTCRVSTDGLDSATRALVTMRVMACHDYEAGRITKRQYQAAIAPRPTAAPAGVMWADSVLGFSTQYSDSAWSAQQALGMPNVFPEHGDLQKAWASREPDAQAEWIELGYATPRSVSAVEIYETFNPGAIESVELITTSGRRITLRGNAGVIDGRVGASQKATFETACTSELIAAVRVNLASHVVEGWNEIDAVGLVPCAEVASAVTQR